MKTIAALLLTAFISLTPANAVQRIMIDWGGQLGVYIDRYNEWRLTGELVVVDGFCISACTLVLALIKPERACATQFARFAFHCAAFQSPTGERTFAREATRIVWHMYPPKLRELLVRRGWQDAMDHSELIYIEGDDLYSIIRPCTATDLLEMKGNDDE